MRESKIDDLCYVFLMLSVVTFQIS